MATSIYKDYSQKDYDFIFVSNTGKVTYYKIKRFLWFTWSKEVI